MQARPQPHLGQTHRENRWLEGGTVHAVRAATAIVADTACEGSLITPGLTVETVVSVPAGSDAGFTDAGSDAGSTDAGPTDAGSADARSDAVVVEEDDAAGDAGEAGDGADTEDGATDAGGGAKDGDSAAGEDGSHGGGPEDTETDDANG